MKDALSGRPRRVDRRVSASAWSAASAPGLRRAGYRRGTTTMDASTLQTRIEALWQRRDTLTPATGGDDRAVVEAALEALDSGKARVAEPLGAPGEWRGEPGGEQGGGVSPPPPRSAAHGGGARAPPTVA